MQRLVNTVLELGDNVAGHKVYIGHSDVLDLARMVGKALTDVLGPLDIEYVVVNPTAGSHCGPNGVGVCFHAKHR
jgi:fatty acid-binding protein DegV